MPERTGTQNKQILILPDLVIKPIRKSIGIVHHVLLSSKEVEVVGVETVQISPRVRENISELGDGTKIIITKRPRLIRTAGIEGVLREDDDGTYHWLSHRLTDDFSARLSSEGLPKISAEIERGWVDKFRYLTERVDHEGRLIATGLRPPQIGGLHAIGAYWSLNSQPATVVMPTGTGKTETMLAVLPAFIPGKTLIVVPSKVLRDQTAKKFLHFGLLRSLGVLDPSVSNPIVGIVHKRPHSEKDLAIFDDCNVLVSTMSVFGEREAISFAKQIAARTQLLIVDEAHHIAANGWSAFKEPFSDKKVLQFTATPYRRDGKLVDGKIIFDYPLHAAQKDGYFKKIIFEPVYELDEDEADKAIAQKAISRLEEDLSAKKNHLIMARCANITRAEQVFAIYEDLAKHLSPILVHSEEDNNDAALQSLRTGASRIVVCVNMLGEGFDLPQLKIAAVHDTHKSLAILLQFTGRFTRTAGQSIGDATVIANIADQEVSSALERLYSEDADWNQLLSELSSEASKAHAALVSFLSESRQLDDGGDDDTPEISNQLLRPTLSTLTFEASSFKPKEFFKGVPREMHVLRAWLHVKSNTLYFVTRTDPALKWTRAKEIRDRQWNVFVLHYDSALNLLFLSSSDKSSNHEILASAVGAGRLISGDAIFRSLGNINRLIFQNIGVKKHGRRNLRYAMYTGADVANALSVSERAGSVKSNVSGTGWENGSPVAIGCSFKGRVWSREQGTIPELVNWCESIGKKLIDDTINTDQIIANVLIPKEVDSLPGENVLSIEWPIEVLRQSEERVVLRRNGTELPISMFEFSVDATNVSTNTISFSIRTDDEVWGAMNLVVGGSEGFKVVRTSQELLNIHIGSIDIALEEYLSNYPPLIRFTDLSELDGNLLISPQESQNFVFPDEQFDVWDWTNVDITKESTWKSSTQRTDSIQSKAAEHFIQQGFELVFDDDSAGEAADLVCLKDEGDFVRLALVHCKFTSAATPGERVKDVVEVSSQAIRSAKWKWKFKDLCRHILHREKALAKPFRSTRFLAGAARDVNKFLKLSRIKEIRPEILIVQPGMSKTHISNEQKTVLAAADSYLKETIGADLDVICSL